MSDFTVSLPLFEGPLDLLLHLIERHELDITQLSLATVTDEYLRAIETMESIDPEGVADFLVVAARLLLIKSRLLLPSTVPVEEGEDEGDDLARALEAYRRFKQVAEGLGERESEGLRSYIRVAPLPALEPRLDPAGLTLDQLVGALQRVLEEQPEAPESVDEVVRPLRVTVRERLEELTARLREGRTLRFDTLLGERPHRQEVIATFLAMLELLKLGWLRVRQDEIWGTIELLPLAEALPQVEGDRRPAHIDEYV